MHYVPLVCKFNGKFNLENMNKIQLQIHLYWSFSFQLAYRFLSTHSRWIQYILRKVAINEYFFNWS